MPGPDPAREQEELAGAEAARIGGRAPVDPFGPDQEDTDEAQGPLAEAGQGEAEGFEQAERELVENASHGDQHAARRAIRDSPAERDDIRAADAGEADSERSSEREEDLP